MSKSVQNVKSNLMEVVSVKEYKLSEESFRLMKEIDFEQIEGKIIFDDRKQTFSTKSIRDVLLTINDEIVLKGMDEKQDSITLHGEKLYRLYDEIMGQRTI